MASDKLKSFGEVLTFMFAVKYDSTNNDDDVKRLCMLLNWPFA